MNTSDKTIITIQATVHAPVEKVWALWNDPEHIMQWNSASPDWHTTSAANDLKTGGKFSYHMAAKDGSMGFDFWGVYDEVIANEKIAYTMGDGRIATVHFTRQGDKTDVVTNFEAESQNPVEMQQFGWQSILNNFKAYAEAQS